jgi:hypothetical protein
MRTEVKYILELIRDKTITIDNGTDRILNISDVSDSDFVEHDLEDEYGYKFCVNLPKDAKDISVINTNDIDIRVGFKTKFGGKKYLQTYIEV